MAQRGGRRKEGRSSERREEGPPSRSLFIRNLSFNVTEDELKVLFNRYGDVKRVFNLIEKRGMAFVTFYDIRAAEAARADLGQVNLKGRMCFVEYDARPADSSGPGESTGCLYAQFRDVRNMPTNEEIARYFSQYGAVSGVYESSHPLERLVEFYDLRDAERAYEQSGRVPYMGGTLESFRAPPRQPYGDTISNNTRRPAARPRSRSRSPSPHRGGGGGGDRGSDRGADRRRYSPPRGADPRGGGGGAPRAGLPPAYAQSPPAAAALAPANVSALLSMLLQPHAPTAGAAYKPPPVQYQPLQQPPAGGLDPQQLGALLSQLSRVQQPPTATAPPPQPQYAPAKPAAQDPNTEAISLLLRQLQQGRQ